MSFKTFKFYMLTKNNENREPAQGGSVSLIGCPQLNQRLRPAAAALRQAEHNPGH
jgi:hypothetical protein